VDEHRTILTDPFEVDHELIDIILGVREDLRSVQRENMIRDRVRGRGRKVGVVDAELGVEPADFLGDQLLWDEALYAMSVR
jgi:hypothetical protein